MTPYEIQFRALRELGVLSVYEHPPAEMGAAAEEKYASLHAELLRYGLAKWALTENVPAYAELPVIWMLAYLCACSDGFGAPEGRRDSLAAYGSLGAPQISLGERKLRAMVATEYVPQPAQSEYF